MSELDRLNQERKALDSDGNDIPDWVQDSPMALNSEYERGWLDGCRAGVERGRRERNERLWYLVLGLLVVIGALLVPAVSWVAR